MLSDTFYECHDNIALRPIYTPLREGINLLVSKCMKTMRPPHPLFKGIYSSQRKFPKLITLETRDEINVAHVPTYFDASLVEVSHFNSKVYHIFQILIDLAYD